ncbi:MAG: hypothetical protein M1820_005363 [Bogoriella megaspora]|nr:MAG: hypothetical protein M1820_005363 [Bogoriella megaspora]
MTSPHARASALAPAAHAVQEDESLSPRSKVSKAVSYASDPEHISPIILGIRKEVDEDDESFSLDRPKLHRANVARRLSGRLSKHAESPSLLPSNKDKSFDLPSHGANGHVESPHKSQEISTLLDQVIAWLQEEKTKSKARKAKRKAPKPQDGSSAPDDPHDSKAINIRRSSDASENGLALDKLEQILEKNLTLTPIHRPSSRKASHNAHRISAFRKLRRHSGSLSSDTDYLDREHAVPSCDAILDNTKTLSYTGGGADAPDTLDLTRVRTKDEDAWHGFKFEIVRLAHTLRIARWRQVPLEVSTTIEVERLSGALTNAIYVVTPPKDIHTWHKTSSNGTPRPKKPPPKLLLRVYGPNVAHLIDRQSELAILCRLAKKRIGPRLLGTFANGRFEEYFHARALTPSELRSPATSKQIAKRMKELHQGIELEEREIRAGPFVWQNWDKWLNRCGRIVQWFDEKALEQSSKATTNELDIPAHAFFVCGVPWEQFRDAVERYRRWLEGYYGGYQNIQEHLVFAHNDTQYGNILRMVPQGDSPLLLPANQHKQLVVIDFEYANANLPGLEFANHFTEWCYDYHALQHPHSLIHSNYPNPSEQERFIRSYVRHRPQFTLPPSTSNTPRLGPIPDIHDAGLETPSSDLTTPRLTPTLISHSSSMSLLQLDPRSPKSPSMRTHSSQSSEISQSSQLDKVEGEEDMVTEIEVQRLLHETRVWRAANSAQWVAWGIVQAKLPKALAKEIEALENDSTPTGSVIIDKPMAMSPAPLLETDPLQSFTEEQADKSKEKRPELLEEEEEEDQGEEGEFDYLAYAHERALFFWGDALQAGVITEEELPEELRAKVKRVEY